MKMAFCTIAVIAMLCSAASSAAPSTDAVPIVAAVEVAGCTRDVQTKVWSNIHVRVGDVCRPGVFSADIKAVSRIRGVANVEVTVVNDRGNAVVRYLLRPAPMVSRVTVVTEKRGLTLPADLVRTRAGRYLSKLDVHRDARRIIGYFRARQYHDVEVTPAVTYELNGMEAAVAFVVREGVPQYVEEVVVSGSGSFDAARVRRMLHCQARRRLGFGGGAFRPEAFADDAWRMREDFASNGFVDATVSITTGPGRSRGGVRVLVDVQQGPASRIAQIAWKSDAFASAYGSAMAATTTVKEGNPWTPGTPATLATNLRAFCTANGMSNAVVSVRSIIHESSSPEEPRIKMVGTVSRVKIRKGAKPASR